MPRKSHHTQSGFRNNYVSSVDRSLIEVLRWQFARVTQRLPPPPTVATPRVIADMEFIAANARAGAAMIPAVSWIGHASMLNRAGS
jgi:N-acyl-phosphatidylethanolamine-hydrolysing phospholipase D